MESKSIILLLLIGISVIGKPTIQSALSQVRIDIHGQRDGIVLKPDSDSNINVISSRSKKPEFFEKIITSHASVDNEWKKIKLAFIPEKDGSVNMILRGKYYRDGKQTWTIYDDISVEGASIKNGDFENGMKSWHILYCGPKDKKEKPELPDDAKSGAASIVNTRRIHVY